LKLKSNLAADAAIFLTTLIWGSTFAVSRDVLDYWPPLSYLALRLPLAALIFAALFPRWLSRAGRDAWRAGAALGLLMTVLFATGAVGPPVFGAIVEAGSWPAGLGAVALAALAARRVLAPLGRREGPAGDGGGTQSL